ncbi:MAG: gamma-butyrobetaine hydroxylase-like domain-containing protein [Pirellulales bacterium]
MELRPTKLELRDKNRLLIEWSDGAQHEIAVSELRSRCPCATCREKRAEPPAPAGSLQVLSLAEARPLAILGMRPVGNYAYSITFSDGHDTGIFTLDFLRELGQAAPG